MLGLLKYATEYVAVSADIIERGRHLETLGYHKYDALHLACAEAAGADVFVTTDDRFLRRMLRCAGSPEVRAINPIEWK